MPPTASRCRESILNDFRNAVGVKADGFGCAKVNEQMVIPRRADISGFPEKKLFAIIEPDAKGTERTPLNQILNFLNFHHGKDKSGCILRKRELSGFRLPAPVFSATMFDTVKTEIATASDKLSHLRRFL